MRVRIDGHVQYAPLPGGGIVEVVPERCRAGHPLEYPNVGIGWDGQHRTYTCCTCWEAGDPNATLIYETGYYGRHSSR